MQRQFLVAIEAEQKSDPVSSSSLPECRIAGDKLATSQLLLQERL